MRRGVKFYNNLISFFLAVIMIYSMGFTGIAALAGTPDVNNGDWTSKNLTLTNTNEAQLMVRVGDIDNFGFGWNTYKLDRNGNKMMDHYGDPIVTGSINPFSGNETQTHDYPFSPSNDPEGTDKIMVVSGYNSKYTAIGTNSDAYTQSRTTYSKAVKTISLAYSLSGISVQNATIQMFLDDFQPGRAHGISNGNVKYTASINGIEIPELSNVINNLDESGPKGKLITFQIPERYLYLVRTGNISLKFDDTDNCTGDGYAIDFVKLLINKTNSTTNTATITGNVKDSNNNNLQEATVSAGGVVTATTDSNGNYTLNNVPAGQAIVTASKSGYNSSTVTIPTVIAGGGYTANFKLTSSTPPTTPVISATPTTPTNNKVTATVSYSADSTIKQYRMKVDGTTGEWNVYTGPFDVTQNCIIEAQGINQYGNSSQIASYTVSNIDKTPPTLTLTQDPTTATNGTVTITATASDNVAVESIAKPDNTVVAGSSTTYAVSANGTYTFTATDTAGNVGTQSINISNINGVSSMPQVKIDVTDSSGLLDEYNANSDNPLSRVDKDVTDKNYVLKGDAYANFSVNSSNANAFQYSIIKNSGKQTDIPNSGWTDLDLQVTDQGNSDVDISKQGYLTQRAYDVNHMATLTDTINWSNPAQVFKYPYPELGYKNADTSATKDAYGHEESVVPYTIIDVNGNPITVSSRWHSNTVFMRNMDIFGAYKEASKFWGYITVPQDGNYVFGAASDDGCRGWITVDGTARQFVNMFQPQSVSFGSTNTVLSLKAGKYYPIYLEYFNWGGSAAFQLYYTNTKSSMHSASDGALIPKDWFYPSKSASPGEYSQTLFTGTKGVKLPSEPGQYYIAYRTGIGTKTDGSTTIDSSKAGYRDGIYGPFVVKPTASLELTKDYDSQNAVAGRYFKINYTITPREIPVLDFSSTNPQNLQVSNIKFNELLPSGLTTDNANINPSSNLQVVLNGNAISGNISQTIQYRLDSTGTKYIADPISFSIWVKSDTASSYSMSGQSSYINYKDIDDGNKKANFNNLDINVSNPPRTKPNRPVITSNPTETTIGKVTVTISYSSDSVTKQYRINDGTTTGDWQTYSAPFEVSKNCTIEAKGIDSAGTDSDIASHDINNIVAAPNVPVINVSPTAFTNDKDIVTITYSDDSTIKQYRIKTGTTTGDWQTYTDPFDVTENCTIEAKGTNQYHIESQTASYDINNIDKIAPSGPTISLNNNNQVMITPGVDNDGGSGVKEVKYKIYSGSTSDNNQTWTTYKNSFDSNMQVFTVQAKTIDNAGNESSVVTQNFDMASIIIKHGIYDVKSNQNDYINTNNKVSNGIPINIAMVINAKAFNPTIDLNIGDISKISDQNINSGIDVKEYEISNGTIGALINEKYLGINNSSISIGSSDGFVMNGGGEHYYMIIYTITPKGTANDTIDMTATVRNTSNSNRLELQIQDMPDLF